MTVMADRLLPLRFALTPSPSAYVNTGVLEDEYRTVTRTARAAIHRRDLDTCRFCGFRSARHQTIVWLDGHARDIDDAVTSCVFCEHVCRLDLVPMQRSGLLVWLPEVSQAVLNRSMGALYLLHNPMDERASRRSRSLHDRLMSRRELAKEQFGSDDARTAAERLRAQAAGRQEGPDPNEAAARGLRLLPLDRRIVRESGIEWNQFPVMLAYWRSPDGPVDMQVPQATRTFDELEQLLTGV